MILINDKDERTQYLGHYYTYYHYKDNNDTLNTEIEKLKDKVSKQIVSMYQLK